MKKNFVVVLVILMAITLAGCNAKQGTSSTPDKTSSTQENTAAGTQKELTVAAAADLIKAFTEVGASFEKANNCTVAFSFGSSGTLSEQIANGAPFDVFAAANESVIDDLDKKGHIISGTRQLYALGRIGIATLKNGKIEAETMEDLLKPEIKKIAIANPVHAPYGFAAKQALVTAGLWNKLEPKMVYGKNISETLTFITTGNADSGFIALSLNDKATLNFNLVNAEMHAPLRQAMAVIKNAKEKELGRKFVEYVNSKEGKEIMSKYGFFAPKV